MAATTLTTFLLYEHLSYRPPRHCSQNCRTLPPHIRTVDVLGSWDNFQESYPLRRDRQAGPGHWRGCHSFKKITCDGHDLDVSGGREGALKMGGTYWYFVSFYRSLSAQLLADKCFSTDLTASLSNMTHASLLLQPVHFFQASRSMFWMSLSSGKTRVIRPTMRRLCWTRWSLPWIQTPNTIRLSRR